MTYRDWQAPIDPPGKRDGKCPLPPLPKRMVKLPRDDRGFPVPWFVQWFRDGESSEPRDGEPDFRVVDARKLAKAVKEKRCWVCGEQLGVHLCFVIGPMCAINRVISEPPSHFECAEFSARACPFLSRPRMRRNEKDLPEERTEAAGFGLKRNPGVACLWVTRKYETFRPHVGAPGILFKLGTPERVLWFAEGREATRAEVLASIESGLPLLRQPAEQEGPAAVAALEQQYARAMPLIPAEPA